ncbi:MAG: hypothetical protein U9R37_04475, partial [Campylobacterota bacterium]|nr:hypothetical protein [Campylobacterota bacterium]
TENPKLTIHSTCIHIKPGPFGAVRSRYTKKDDYTFNRKDLGKNIGKFIPPRTLVVIEVYEDTDKLVKFDNKNTNLKSKATVFNVLKTKDNKNQSVQMPLDTFSLTINGEKQTFGLIESEKNQSVEYESITNINDNITIQSSEKFDHTIASY